MAWIQILEAEESKGSLKDLYEKAKSPSGHIDNTLKVHSLRPRTLQAHLYLYKAALHSKPNGLTPRERELVGVCVSRLNGCEYCVQHHTAGLAGHIQDPAVAEELGLASVGEAPAEVLTQREQALCVYAAKLTQRPGSMVAEDLEPLREFGLDDAGILDLNQIVAYFAYANRTVNGLGVEVAGEPLGLGPDEDREGFQHR
jgi:uncharacterized peroxidase-related enzyme